MHAELNSGFNTKMQIHAQISQILHCVYIQKKLKYKKNNKKSWFALWQGVVCLVFVEVAYLWLMYMELRKPPPIELVSHSMKIHLICSVATDCMYTRIKTSKENVRFLLQSWVPLKSQSIYSCIIDSNEWSSLLNSVNW